MKKLLVFDLDGVLVNSEICHHEVCTELMSEAAGFPVDTAPFHFPGIDTVELYRIGLERCGAEGNPAEMSRMHFERTLDKIFEKHPKPDPHLLQMLRDDRLKSIRKFVASSSPCFYVESVLDRYGIRGEFAAVLTGSDVRHLKPSPELYNLALETAAVFSEEAVAIEDSRIGSLAAVAAGVDCIGYINPTSGEQDLSACVMQTNSFRKILEFLFPGR